MSRTSPISMAEMDKMLLTVPGRDPDITAYISHREFDGRENRRISIGLVNQRANAAVAEPKSGRMERGPCQVRMEDTAAADMNMAGQN